MKLEKIILLLDRENNDDLLDYVIPFIREYSSMVYFLYVIEIPVKYDIDYEVGNEINLGETILSNTNKYLQEKKINYDLNGENFILLQSRNSGVGIVKEAKRIKANVIIYRKQKNDDSYKYKYIDKYSEVDTIQLFKV
ncbi:MAG: hypothetical protein FI730_03360 [SAR202 cluster bacterium]|nr:hypothetical protein [SAR202 cluster bacterium]MQF93476.1 hypothetical protein [SAR202 cluster bacterium]|tara:strand:- start:38306 stop:38719 length:414 start_codon:yes stop_codon:yes gene_type:complete